MADTPVLTFEVFRGNQLIQRQELSAESVTIGKGPAAMLRIEDDALADLQAVININDDGTVQLLDLVGEGTLVNGAPMVNAELRNGDSVEIGAIRVVIGIPNAEAFADDEATQIGRADKAEGVNDEVTEHTAPGLPADLAAAAGAAAADEAASEGTEDVMAFVMRSGTSQSDLGHDRAQPPVLEVVEIYSDIVLDVKHYAKGSKPVTIGSSTGFRWRVAGSPVAWVPPWFSNIAPLLAPTISEASEEWRTEFYVPNENLPNDEFELFTWEGGSWYANVSAKWDGFVDIGESRHTLQEMREKGKATASGAGMWKVEVADNTRLMVDIGNVVFFAQVVPAAKKVVTKLTDDLDYPFLGFFSFAFFLGLMFGIYVINAPPRPDSDIIELPDRFVELLLEQPPEPPPDVKKPDQNPDAGEGAKAKREEGKVGKKDAKMERAKGDKVEMNKQQVDREIAENAGVLGAMRDGGEMDGVFGTSGLNSNITGGVGGLIGAKGTQIGSGGLGSRGSGLGGGGTADGLGGLGTKGRGSGASGYGEGGGNFGQKSEGGISRIGGDPIILGALDKSLIDEVIKRNMNQIRYCYQRELTKNPELGGKIVVKFVIAKDGTVSSATTKSTTMGSPAVEDCINGRFLRFKFPEPKGGGIVIVSYPFIFSPG